MDGSWPSRGSLRRRDALRTAGLGISTLTLPAAAAHGIGTQMSLATAPETDVGRQVVAVIGPAGGRVHVSGAASGPLVATDAAYTGDSTATSTSATLDVFNVNPRPQTGPVTLDGRVAIVRLYASALTSAEVERNYEAERRRFDLPAL